MGDCLTSIAGFGPSAPASPNPAYADQGFEEIACSLERLLDEQGGGNPAVRSAYRRAMRQELAFLKQRSHPDD